MGNTRRDTFATAGRASGLQTMALSSEEVELVKLVRHCGGVEGFLEKTLEAASDGSLDEEYELAMPDAWAVMDAQKVRSAAQSDALNRHAASLAVPSGGRDTLNDVGGDQYYELAMPVPDGW